MRNITRDDGLFQSTLSVRRATSSYALYVVGTVISIHALRKESDTTQNSVVVNRSISIHALRKESDPENACNGRWRKISIHALRKESDTVTL